jgi:hypothetical protein
MADPLPKYARVSTDNPEGWAQCDRCSFWRNRSDLVWQFEWAGMNLYNKEILVCSDRCYDIPQEQFRTIILPPDPPPIVNARVPNYAYEEQTVMVYQFGGQKLPPWGAGPQLEMCNQQGTQVFILQYLTSS